jgi:NAD+--asparagine ADP-ribosyltransferase
MMMKDDTKIEHKIYYKRYCKILSTIIKKAKKLYYKEVITKSKNKMNTTWNIIRKETNRLTNKDSITSLRIKDQIIHNKITIANELNNYFLNIAGSVGDKRINEKGEEASPLQNLLKCPNQPFQRISWHYTSTK